LKENATRAELELLPAHLFDRQFLLNKLSARVYATILFNPNTTIQFSIPLEGFVSLDVFYSLSEKVSTLVSENLNT